MITAMYYPCAAVGFVLFLKAVVEANTALTNAPRDIARALNPVGV